MRISDPIHYRNRFNVRSRDGDYFNTAAIAGDNWDANISVSGPIEQAVLSRDL